MGLDYRFHVVFPVGAADAALGALARELGRDDRARVAAALPWQAANARVISWRGAPIWERAGVLSLARREQDRSDAFCFLVRTTPDTAREPAEGQRITPVPSEAEPALLACWISVASGARLFVISATPVSQELRRSCEASEALVAPWQRLASAAHAHALFLDTEPQLPRRILYPAEREVPRPSCAEFELSDHSVATDAYWSDALERAGIDLPPLSSPPRASVDPAQNET